MAGRRSTPLGQLGGAALLEDVSADGLTVETGMVPDRGVDRSDCLKGLDTPEVSYGPFSSSKRPMGVFRPVVMPATAMSLLAK